MFTFIQNLHISSNKHNDPIPIVYFDNQRKQTKKGYKISQIYRIRSKGQLNPIKKNRSLTQSQTPKTIKRVPNKAYPSRVSSPKSIPITAVAANVVALVTGTAREMGVWPRIAKKEAEAERLRKSGTEYCHVRNRLR